MGDKVGGASFQLYIATIVTRVQMDRIVRIMYQLGENLNIAGTSTRIFLVNMGKIANSLKDAVFVTLQHMG